jgi:hypothetical protein
MAAIMVPVSPFRVTVGTASLLEALTGVRSKPKVYPWSCAHPTWKFAWHCKQDTQAPLVFLQSLHVWSYRSVAAPMPSTVSSRAALLNLASGCHRAQYTWTQLLSAVRFSGSRGTTGRPFSCCFARYSSLAYSTSSFSIRSLSLSRSVFFL